MVQEDGRLLHAGKRGHTCHDAGLEERSEERGGRHDTSARGELNRLSSILWIGKSLFLIFQLT